MHLEGDFEEEFGRDILSGPARRVASKMSECVVALASYNGDCTIISLLSSIYYIYMISG
jgi:hypothetical protein